MATYKLIQDVEAEDKILGPLTLRQFVFAIIAVFLFYMCFLVIARQLTFFLVVLLPPALFFGFFALPFGRDQPTEVWALAKLRFFFKPRRRVWNQSGVKELVTITVPKRIEPVLTNGLSPNEVQSRLKALASTIDSRGWAVKNVNLNAYSTPALVAAGSDRLVNLNNIPQPVPDSDVSAADDMLDESNNPVAQQFQSMINQSQQNHRQRLVNQLSQQGGSQPPLSAQQPAQDQPMPAAGGAQNGQWFVGQNAAGHRSVVPQAASFDPAVEAELTSKLKSQAASHPAPYSHLRTLTPAPAAPVQTPDPVPQPPVTSQPDPAILSLANNDDLNVSTIAHEAQRAKGEEDQGEVSISLR